MRILFLSLLCVHATMVGMLAEIMYNMQRRTLENLQSVLKKFDAAEVPPLTLDLYPGQLIDYKKIATHALNVGKAGFVPKAPQGSEPLRISLEDLTPAVNESLLNELDDRFKLLTGVRPAAIIIFSKWADLQVPESHKIACDRFALKLTRASLDSELRGIQNQIFDAKLDALRERAEKKFGFNGDDTYSDESHAYFQFISQFTLRGTKRWQELERLEKALDQKE